jgi:hypothetical protein
MLSVSRKISNRRKIFWAIFVVAGFLIIRLVSSAQAATSTVRGAAWWSDEYRYIYFDCLDDLVSDQLDVAENLYAYPEPRGFHFYATPCTNLVHHVSIDNDGNFSGTAWNYSQGLISLEATTTPDADDPPDNYAFNVNCPNTCNAGNNCWACYNESTQLIHGWARTASSGDWIRLDNATATPVALQSWDYLDDSVLPGHDVEPGDFVGYATSTLGDISFNCESEGGGAGNCATRDYKVYISNLQVGHLSAPNWSYSNACNDEARKAVLKWYLKSGTQNGYEIVVNDTNSFSTSTSDYICWSGIKTPSVASQYIIPNTDPGCPALDYNTHYYWWIRLFDAEGEATEWYQYGVDDGHLGSGDEATDGNPDSDIRTFTTYAHEFPTPYFTWEPYEVLVGTTTEFTSDSYYYDSAAPAVPLGCSTSTCSYLWTTDDVSATISDDTAPTTSIIFFQATGTVVNLSTTDPDSYVCSTSTTVNINYDLPLWREIKAE